MVDLTSEEPNYNKQSRTALRGLLFIAIIAAMYFARDFLLPLVLASLIALTFKPTIRYLSKHHIAPWLSAILLAVALVAGGLSAGYLLSWQVSSWVDQAPQLSQVFLHKFSGIRSWLEVVVNVTDKLQDAATPAGSIATQEVVVREPVLPGWLIVMTWYPLQITITLMATLVFAVFLMASGDLFYEKLVRVLPTLTDRKQAIRIVYELETEVSTYLLTLTAINAILGLAVALAFHALGMPSPYLWGLLTFFFNFIPYVGALTGVALSGFLAIVTFDSLGYALLIPAAFTALSLIESEIASPLVLSRRLQMNSVAILLSLAFWAWLWGIPGAAIAVPVLVTIKVFCNHIDGLAGLGEFLSERQAGKNGPNGDEASQHS
ncbi:MAG TPA: AI-2E family transporter [Aestuariivirga sp.]|jgi:predicted PurR-regulated permease PerM|nr:AI-2E family transporter [Hyphomicrobiales bacterium]MCC7481867.1 AI-2E family transporter [Hyphomicrobiales bacterium]HQY72701.1 AI-2E family transporter [Aestuariivirga sp.]HRA92425.1 AI-2E family transporter [Aestuariivirga sp.]